jgi:hypothetical protein
VLHTNIQPHDWPCKAKNKMSVSAPLFEYERDAVRVKACYVNSSGKEVHKKFSVDPNLTSHDTLR